MTLRLRNFERKILKSVAFMRIEGEDVEEKALQLSGTDVGGWTAIVKPAPLQKVFIDDPCCPDLLLPRQTKHTRKF
ncbi:hypothetical protein ISN45_Aa06g002300 [Arabidopsis thaliana x Arabidopsis arenosa]|uniref:Uncharacterized protein n=1 Tax=Arabidopsis thaliana x Arabidopsis arenosa TaxID=1240361 RepID=A0A8T1YT66_9BRAS|nr:hypothetical protein ISN45_Aa06g002300 [Arabidopsis thaliana x Arabidopsis arenosa]